ncbi:hypothetical protein Hte_011910 [Hypoxylon texense]
MKQYVYNELGPGDQRQAIRLLLLLPGKQGDPLRCTIETNFLGNYPDYEALSYSWGSDQATERIICNDNTYLALNQSPSSALRQLRHDRETRIIWADAICINQSDLDEKSIQVNMMKDIYRQARQVLVWLGEDQEGNTLKTLVKLMQELSKVDNRAHPKDRVFIRKAFGSRDKHMLALSSLLEKPWFRRIWVIQEVAMAKEAVIHCGSESLPWEGLCSILELENGINAAWANNQIIMDIVAGIAFERKAVRQGTPPCLLQVLLRHRASLASDPRDKIYALLGLCNDDLVEANYKLQASDLHRLLTQAHLRRYCNLDIITVPSSPFYQDPRTGPSWVPDWGALDTASPLALRTQLTDDTKYDATSQSTWRLVFSENNAMLGVEAQFLDRISALGDVRLPYRPKEPDLISFFKWLQTDIRVHQSWYKICLKNATSWKAPYCTGETIFDVHWHILLAGCSKLEFEELGKQMKEICETYRIFVWASKMRLLLMTTLRFKNAVAKWTSQYSFFYSFFRRIIYTASKNYLQLRVRRSISYRRMMRTGGDYLGLVPALAQVGDHVVLLRGTSAPAVLRQCDSGYKLIGDCYVHGVMNGETFNSSECKDIWLV